jgi:acyl carrier protein
LWHIFEKFFDDIRFFREQKCAILYLAFRKMAMAIGDPITALEREIASMIVSALNLEVSPDAIQPEMPLYGGELGLDSIDILEIALVVSKQFGIEVRADSEDNFSIFSSLRSLAAYIAEHRTK